MFEHFREIINWQICQENIISVILNHGSLSVVFHTPFLSMILSPSNVIVHNTSILDYIFLQASAVNT